MAKKLIFILFGLIVFLFLPSFAEAACQIAPFYKASPSDCRWGYYGAGVERLGIIGTIEKVPATNGYVFWHPSCEDAQGKCSNSGFPTGYDGQSCTARDACWLIVCSEFTASGYWDFSDSKCVTCSEYFESRNLGGTAAVYAGCGSESGNPGDGQCESACGAEDACDEKFVDDICGFEKICNYNCECVTDIPDPDCSSACQDIGYNTGTCFPGSTNCSVQGYPKAVGNNCWYDCYNKSGTACDGTCLCLNLDSPEPSSYYQSGSNCYYNCNVTCKNNDGWYRDTSSCTNCNLGTCCDCISSGCNANDNNCSGEVECLPSPDCTCEEVGEPDLIINSVSTGGSNISYNIKNQGDGTAGGSVSSLSIDGVYKTNDSVASLSAGGSSNESFSYSWTCSGISDIIRVCADSGGSVAESNETNNCNQTTVSCTVYLPDLVITNIWAEGSTIHYNIANQAVGATAMNSPTSLYVNGSYQIAVAVNFLYAGQSRDEAFEYYTWTCPASPDTDTIRICADCGGGDDCVALIDESNEGNNCKTENLSCPPCTGSLDVSISGIDTCTVTSSLTVSGSGCNGQSWQIKDNGITKCSGTVSGDPYSYTCPDWTVGAGSYTYNLYINDELKDSEPVTCLETPNEDPTCSLLSATPDSGDAPLLVEFTGSGTDTDGSIVAYEWDFDGDGIWDNTTLINTDSHTYDTPDTYTAKLRVQDDDGAWSSIPAACTQVITVTEAGPVIASPGVATNMATNITQTSATLNGYLDSLGYDPEECPDCQCIVWFEWKLSATSTWNKTTPVSMTAEGPFAAVHSDLTPGETYDFKAFAKTAGSW